jgi:succinyl-diaminopimelate desuccinylase
MPDPTLERIRAWLDDHRDDLLRDTVAMLKIPSLESEPLPNAPYGRENREALDLALRMAADAGMRTVDLDGHIGYGEFGQGEPLVMSLGHLDVVPVGPGWKFDPFGATFDGGYIYARGAVDDKGPTMASFYAMRAIKECFPDLRVRMRQVFGCNEESGFGCVEHYAKHDEAPTFGVAPDSGWPCYHAEKGIANLEITFKPPSGEFELLEIHGGQRPNIVIDSCTARVRVGESARAGVEEALAKAWDRNVATTWDGNELEVRAGGKASHGSHPWLGDSAAVRVFRLLYEIAPLEHGQFFEELLETAHPSGVGLGIHGRDDVAGDLTCNLGVVTTEGDRVRLLFNVRYPVLWKGEDLERRCQEHLERLVGDFRLEITRDSPPLYFPLDHPMVKTIIDVYAEETGETREPGTMGGGTYARALPNTVSIGTGWDGDGKAHETDERVKVESLHKMARIYAHILYRLARQAGGS